MSKSRHPLLRWSGLGLVSLLSACTNIPLSRTAPAAPPAPAAQSNAAAAPGPAPYAPQPQAQAGPQLPPPRPVSTPEELSRQAAERIVAANPEHVYLGAPQEMLLAIPVLEVELNGDGSIKQVRVLRYPTQAPESVQIAIDAVRRAAPFGDVRRLPKPWVFVETFLFNDDLRFKPRSLD